MPSKCSTFSAGDQWRQVGGRSATRGIRGKPMMLPSSSQTPSLRCRFVLVEHNHSQRFVGGHSGCAYAECFVKSSGTAKPRHLTRPRPRSVECAGYRNRSIICYDRHLERRPWARRGRGADDADRGYGASRRGDADAEFRLGLGCRDNHREWGACHRPDMWLGHGAGASGARARVSSCFPPSTSRKQGASASEKASTAGSARR
jgi:hypothetical protein